MTEIISKITSTKVSIVNGTAILSIKSFRTSNKLIRAKIKYKRIITKPIFINVSKNVIISFYFLIVKHSFLKDNAKIRKKNDICKYIGKKLPKKYNITHF